MAAAKSAAATPAPKFKSESPFPQYKGKPLVRQGNTVYYGYMSDPFIGVLSIETEHEENGQKIADKIQIQVLNTDPKLNMLEAIVKNGHCEGLYKALDLAAEWIERA